MQPRTEPSCPAASTQADRQSAAGSRSRRAFTLTEMLLVVFILGVVAAALIPEAQAWQSRAQVREAATALQSTLQTARTRAIESGETWTVRIDPAGNRFTIEPATRRDLPAKACNTPLSSALPACRISATTGVRSEIPEIRVQFRPDGTADALRLRLENDAGNAVALQVDRLTGACQFVDVE